MTHRWRLLAPVLFSLAILAVAPALGRLRNLLLDAFGSGALALVAGATALAGALAFVVAVARIREHRRLRYGLLAVAALLVVVQVLWWRSGDARVDVVERIHLLEYGTLAALWLWAFAPRVRDWTVVPLALLATGLVGLADEAVQWATQLRVGDGRDVLLNLFAGVVGLAMGLALAPPAGLLERPVRRPTGGSFARLAGLAAAFVLAAALFVHLAHLGVWVEDPEIGAFRSTMNRAELLETRDRRAAAWRAAPPTELRAYALEDLFLTEAARHVQARNAAFAREDWESAWRENRILERYYAPFLEIRSFASGEIHAWPPEQRRMVEERWAEGAAARPAEPTSWRSRALAGRIVTSPSSWGLWTGAGLLAGLLGGVAVRVRRRSASRARPRRAEPVR